MCDILMKYCGLILLILLLCTCLVGGGGAVEASSADGSIAIEQYWHRLGPVSSDDANGGTLHSLLQWKRDAHTFLIPGANEENAALIAATDPPAYPPSSGEHGSPDTLAPEFTRSLSSGFIPNAGQYDPAVSFVLQYQGTTVFFTQEGLVLTHTAGDEESRTTDVIRQTFGGASPDTSITGLDEREGRVNYYVGNDSSHWLTDIPVYGEIIYENLYPGIDLVYSEENGRLKREFRVAPGASPDLIELLYDDGITPAVDDAGILRFASPAGEMLESPLICWQVIEGEIVPRSAGYLIEKGSVRIAVAEYDPGYELVIDPELVYSTYLGGIDGDSGHALAPDGSGGVWIAGSTSSTNFPLTDDANQGSYGGAEDAFVSRFSCDGALLYSTYLSGSDRDYTKALAPDGSGGIWITGLTSSTNFPVTDDAHQGSAGDWDDAFVSRFSSDGTLLYSTYLGGSESDYANALAPDGSDGVWITGLTRSSNFPVTDDACQGSYTPSPDPWTFGRTSDVFVSRFSSTGDLIYSTYLGGTWSEEAFSIETDNTGGVWIVGNVINGGFPVTTNAYQSTFGGGHSDAFIAHFSSTGHLLYSTYLGGNQIETTATMDRTVPLLSDGSGGVWVAGMTASADFPVTDDAHQGSYGGGDYDAFVSRFSSAGALLYSTYLGGSGLEYYPALAPDGSGGVWFAGHTRSKNFPVTDDAHQGNAGYYGDAFVSRFSSAGALLYSTYLGGSDWEYCHALAADGSGGIWITGLTSSTNFPLTDDANQGSYGGAEDAFVSRISYDGALLYSTYLGGSDRDSVKALAPDGSGGVWVAGSAQSYNFPVTPDAYQGSYGGGNYDAFISRFSVSGISPTLTTLNPTSITAGSDAFTLQITGTNFISGANILWEGQERSTVFVSSTELTATILKADIANAGMYIIKVVNPNGVGSGELYFEVTPSSSGELLPPPTLLGPGDPSSPGPIIDTLTPQFSWTLVPDANEYGLYIRNLNTDTIIFDSRLDGHNITGNAFTLPSGILQPDTHYRWNMNSHSSAGWNDDLISGYSQKFYFTTPSGPQPPALPVITESLTLSPGPYKVGDTISAAYTIRNDGSSAITFSNLTVGGRYNLDPGGDGTLPDGLLPDGTLPDFTHRSITLQPGESYDYQGEITFRYVGEYHFFCAYSPYSGDPSGWNCNIPVASPGIGREVDIDVKIPVILIHGWNGSPDIWSELYPRLVAEGYPVLILDYKDYNKIDPRIVANTLRLKIEEYKAVQQYDGKFDIVCHSMGALVSRWYIEQLGGEENIRQWIGIAPTSHGTAIADYNYEIIRDIFGGDAARELMTDSDTISNLSKDVSTDPITYRVLVGVNTAKNPSFGVLRPHVGFLDLFLDKYFLKLGKTRVMWVDSSGEKCYGWTYYGDGLVAAKQSAIVGAHLDYFEGLDHSALPKNSVVISCIITYLKNPNIESFTTPPSEIDDLCISPTNPMVGGQIIFDASPSVLILQNGETGDIKWDFGDGTWSSSTKSEHLYTEPKNYNVKLKIINKTGTFSEQNKELNLSLELGDILLDRSGGWPGTIVPGYWSHAGMYIGDNKIIEALGDGVTITDLSTWSYPNKTYVAVYRVKDIQPEIRQEAVNFSISKEGKPYDLRSIFLPPSKQIECDWCFIEGPPGCNNYYCSELVWAAYLKAANINLDSILWGAAIAPEEIADSPFTEFIGQHFEDCPVKIFSPFSGWTDCNVDIIIIDPDGRELSKFVNEIPYSFYGEEDLNNDGVLDDYFCIPEPIPGDYSISVVQSGTILPNETYSLHLSNFNSNKEFSPVTLVNESKIIELNDSNPLELSFVKSGNSTLLVFPSQGLIPLEVNCIGLFIPNNSSTHWSFGDGTSAENVTEVTHTYTAPGNYTVTLTLYGPDGEDSASQIVNVMPLLVLEGDLNNNGGIDWGDVVMCAYMSWDLIDPDPDVADFNGNDVVDWGDVVKLAYYYWGMIPEL